MAAQTGPARRWSGEGRGRSEMSDVTILLADDHHIVRQGLVALLSAESGFEVVGEASDGREAVQMAEDLKPDVVVMDVGMPTLNGIEATRRVTQKLAGTKVVILSMYKREEYAVQALRSGAMAFVVKDSAVSELVKAVRTVMEGKPYLSPALGMRAPASTKMGPEVKTPFETLTPREREILQLIAEGNTNKQIGKQLFISVKTVETHRLHIMQKLDLHDVASLTRFALTHGLVTPETA
jgi:DNA-binding NarL/FixJ family response regulator